MSASVLFAALWVIASAVVAMLPMKRQYAPGMVLFIAAPLLIVWLGYDYGFLVGAIGLFGFVSMFRNPLIYYYRRFRGQEPEIPE